MYGFAGNSISNNALSTFNTIADEILDGAENFTNAIENLGPAAVPSDTLTLFTDAMNDRTNRETFIHPFFENFRSAVNNLKTVYKDLDKAIDDSRLSIERLDSLEANLRNSMTALTGGVLYPILLRNVTSSKSYLCALRQNSITEIMNVKFNTNLATIDSFPEIVARSLSIVSNAESVAAKLEQWIQDVQSVLFNNITKNIRDLKYTMEKRFPFAHRNASVNLRRARNKFNTEMGTVMTYNGHR